MDQSTIGPCHGIGTAGDLMAGRLGAGYGVCYSRDKHWCLYVSAIGALDILGNRRIFALLLFNNSDLMASHRHRPGLVRCPLPTGYEVTNYVKPQYQS